MKALLWLIARLVPPRARQRWLEEWRAELAHGHWTMVFGALPDAWALRRLSLLPPEGGRTSSLGPFHADLRYAARGLAPARGFTFAVAASLAVGIAVAGGALGGGTPPVLGALVHASIVGVPSVDGTLFVAAADVLVTAMVLASVIPARRASRVDLITVLRQE